MNLYTKEQVASIHKKTFAFIEVEESKNVLTITLNRANKKNALHPQMVHEIAFAMHYAHFQKSIWVLILQAKGDVFCAGADLKAMTGIVEENNSTIPPPNREVLIGELFNKVHKPVIAKVTGDVYAGGFFFLAGSTYVVALEEIKLGLPEVKRGLYPMQVMAALLRILPPRKVIDWCIRGYNLPVATAAELGLVTHIATSNNLDKTVESLIWEIKANSPTAIRLGLEAFDHIRSKTEEHKYLAAMLQKAIQSKDGQEGLNAFKEKRKPVWRGE